MLGDIYFISSQPARYISQSGRYLAIPLQRLIRNTIHDNENSLHVKNGSTARYGTSAIRDDIIRNKWNEPSSYHAVRVSNGYSIKINMLDVLF